MLAALIATRQIIPPPPPPAIIYGNQFVAATTTFACIGFAKQAAALSTNPTFSYQLLFSTQAQPSIVDQLNLYYYRIVNYLSSNANITMMPSNLYLSNQIAGVIATAIPLNAIIQALPVANANANALLVLQQKMAVALRLLQSLAIPITLNYS